MPGKTGLILGGGTGGLVAANRLRRLLGDEHRVVLIDRSPLYSFAPSFTWVMIGQRDGRRISRDLRSLQKKGIDFLMGEITAIELGEKKVRLGDQEVEYDYLIIALGAQYSSEEVPGLNRAWTFYHLDGAEGLAEELPKFRGGRIAVVATALPYKCPPAPYEGALLLDDYFRRRKLRGDVQVHVYTPEAAPLTAAGEHVGQAVLRQLARRDIGFTGKAALQSVDHASHKLSFQDGTQADFDLLIATPIHRVPDVLKACGLAPEGGWVPVDRETLATKAENVFAIGDATSIPMANGLPLPKAGVFAHGEAEVVARNIAAEINEGRPIWAFGGQGACFLETGGGKASYVSGHFFAEPTPHVTVRGPSRYWHWAKLGFERVWLWRWF